MRTWKPRDYQLKGIEFVLTQGAGALFLDPGLGKTSTILAAIKILKSQNIVQRVLIVAPLRVAYLVWPLEVRKWEQFSSLSVHVLHGRRKVPGVEADVYIVNPDGLKWLIENYPRGYFDMLVVDESTMFKNPGTTRFKQFRRYVSSFSRRYILTGTPYPRCISNLWSQIYLLDFGAALGSNITQFRKEYMELSNPFVPYSWVVREGAEEEIAKKIAPLCLRMEASEHLDLPELVVNDVIVTLPRSVQDAYDDVEEDFHHKFPSGEEVLTETAAVAGTKLRQIANGNVYTDSGAVEHLHNEKLTALLEIIDELQGKPVLVFYEFKHDCATITERIPHAVNLTAATVSELEDIEARFNAGEISVLLAHPGSAAHGLNLQGACYTVCWYGVPWDYELYTQGILRVYRQGQRNPYVVVHRILGANTKDMDVAQRLEDKACQERVFLKRLT